MSECFVCGNKFPDNFKVYRTTECPSCGCDVKVCLNCYFYSPYSKYDCKEHIPEAVREKDKSNFCDYFKLSDAKRSGKIENKAKKARLAFDDLFNE